METRVKHKGKYYKIEVECVFEKTREGGLGNWDKVPVLCKFFQPFCGGRCKHVYFTRLKHSYKPLKCHNRQRKIAQIKEALIAEALERI